LKVLVFDPKEVSVERVLIARAIVRNVLKIEGPLFVIYTLIDLGSLIPSNRSVKLPLKGDQTVQNSASDTTLTSNTVRVPKAGFTLSSSSVFDRLLC
jgi:hypothetical protein